MEEGCHEEFEIMYVRFYNVCETDVRAHLLVRYRASGTAMTSLRSRDGREW